MTYLAVWQFDSSNGRLKTQTGGNSIAASVQTTRFSIQRIRGIISAHDAYYVGKLSLVDETAVGDMNARAGLYIWKPGTFIPPIERVLPRGAGGMAYSPNGDLMWTVGAAQGARGVVGMLAGGFLESQTSSSPDNSTGVHISYLEDFQIPSQHHAGAIAGGVLGGFFIAVGVLYWWWRRRRQAGVIKEAQLSGGDESSKGELPTYKPELDASVSRPATAAARDMKSQQDVEYFEKGYDKEARTQMPTELPGVEPWAELEAVEKPVELP